MAAEDPPKTRREWKEQRRQERVAREEQLWREEKDRQKAENPSASNSNKSWRVDAVSEETTVSVWNDGANATVGTVADFMEKLYEGEIGGIVVTRDVFEPFSVPNSGQE